MTKKLIYGVGINDADYTVQLRVKGGKTIHCPFYTAWVGVLCRCYSDKWRIKYPTYIGCAMVESWHRFSTFRSWMETQDWKDKVLDKDILLPGNKLYGPGTCVFVSSETNKFCNENEAARGDWPIGVTLSKGKYFVAMCKDVQTNKPKYLGSYQSSDQAHQAWLAYKLEQAYILASKQTDGRVAKALVDRYKNYKSN